MTGGRRGAGPGLLPMVAQALVHPFYQGDLGEAGFLGKDGEGDLTAVPGFFAPQAAEVADIHARQRLGKL